MSLKSFGRRKDGSKPPAGTPLPIFFDPTRRRQSVLRILGSALLLAFLIWSIAFGASLYALTKLADIRTVTEAGQTAQPAVPSDATGDHDDAAAGTPAPAVASERPVYAFLPFEPEWSFVPLAKALPKIDVLLPEWYRLNLAAGKLEPMGFDEPHQRDVAAVLRRRSPTTLLPVAGLNEKATAAQIAAALRSPELSRRMAVSIAETVAERRYGGLCLDLSPLPEAAYEDAARLLGALQAQFRGTNRKTCLIAPLDSTIWDHPSLMAAADRAVVLGFRHPRAMAAAGPPAPRAWFARRVATLLDSLDPAKVVIALGAMGYDWSDGGSSVVEVNYADAMGRAGLHDTVVAFDKPALNSSFSYVDSGRHHDVWILDAASAYNELVALSDRKLAGVAVWPLTGADPAIWNLVTRRLPVENPGALLATVDLADYIGYRGSGPFLRLLRTPQPGTRTVEVDAPSGLIVAAGYSRLPQPYAIERYGQGAKATVALTFDDGPDPDYTREILDILKANEVPATFFVIGKNALSNPDLVERMVRDGHEVGVHTFFHPVLEHSWAWRIRFEVNATERLIAGITGRQTLLFRAPYAYGQGPLTGSEGSPIHQIEQYGYAVVGAHITPPDWTDARPDQLVAAIDRGINPAGGTVIQLHDGGGDRTATIKALPRIIETLRRQGYTFVPLGTFIGKTRDEMMPVDTSVAKLFDAASFAMLHWLAYPLFWIFFGVTILTSIRAAMVILLAHLRKPHAAPDKGFTPPVTVVIAAYCEESVIARTLTAVLASDYPDFRVIVVDDGSSDRTAAVIGAAFGSDPRVRLLSQPNAGKAAALNNAYAVTETDIVIAIDADTAIEPDAIRLLVRHFQNPQIGAVAGNVKVGNRRSLIARLQSLEYVATQNIDRRAAELLNGILVVPGALGAWRRAAVAKAGHYSSQTLAEDADLTIALVRAGYRVVFEEAACATTEAPETIRQFLRQRLRWMLGMFQAAWKHRRAIIERHWIGLFSIPELLLFSIMVATVAPIADLVFLAAMIDYGIDRLVLPDSSMAALPLGIIAAYSVYLLADILVTVLALRLEPKEDKRQLLLFPFQRFLYRQLMYLSAMRALYAALSGRLMRWQKVTRSFHAGQPDAAAARAARRQIQLTPK